VPTKPPTAVGSGGTPSAHVVEAKPFGSRQYKGEHSKLYSLSRWRHKTNGLAAAILRRDPICKICNREASQVADHIQPHRGIAELFWDPKNLQGICKQCHQVKTAAEINQRQGNQSAIPLSQPPRLEAPKGPTPGFDYLAAIQGQNNTKA